MNYLFEKMQEQDKHVLDQDPSLVRECIAHHEHNYQDVSSLLEF